jgi:hypothetical protein
VKRLPIPSAVHLQGLAPLSVDFLLANLLTQISEELIEQGRT